QSRGKAGRAAAARTVVDHHARRELRGGVGRIGRRGREAPTGRDGPEEEDKGVVPRVIREHGPAVEIVFALAEAGGIGHRVGEELERVERVRAARVGALDGGDRAVIGSAGDHRGIRTGGVANAATGVADDRVTPDAIARAGVDPYAPAAVEGNRV